jgi:hypothetical protein
VGATIDDYDLLIAFRLATQIKHLNQSAIRDRQSSIVAPTRYREVVLTS